MYVCCVCMCVAYSHVRQNKSVLSKHLAALATEELQSKNSLPGANARAGGSEAVSRGNGGSGEEKWFAV